MSGLKEINEDTFESEVLKSPVPVLVDFTATWCGPCKLIAPILAELNEIWAGGIKIVKVDVDVSYLTARRYGILSIPTLMLFREGKSIERIMGVVSKAEIERKVKNALTV